MSYTGLHLPSMFMISAVATSLPLRGAQTWFCSLKFGLSFLIMYVHIVIITQNVISSTFTGKGSVLWPPCPNTRVLIDLCKYICKFQDLDFIQLTFGRIELNINHQSLGQSELICNHFLLLFGEDTARISPSDFSSVTWPSGLLFHDFTSHYWLLRKKKIQFPPDSAINCLKK